LKNISYNCKKCDTFCDVFEKVENGKKWKWKKVEDFGQKMKKCDKKVSHCDTFKKKCHRVAP
jgi:hypothetical protein